MTKPKYKRILLKLSGEALGSEHASIDAKVVEYIATELLSILELGVEVGLIVGGGNFIRGGELSIAGVERVTGDYMGMIATLINALAMQDIFVKRGIVTQVMSALSIGCGITENFDRQKAIYNLRHGRVVIMVGGTGNPLVTTDSALSLRGVELNADLLLKATNVDGIYSGDPRTDKKATLYQRLTYKEALAKELAVMDLASFIQCRDHNMTLRVYNLRKQGALLRIVSGEDEGTLITNQPISQLIDK
jgi:uridylate kinase